MLHNSQVDNYPLETNDLEAMSKTHYVQSAIKSHDLTKCQKAYIF